VIERGIARLDRKLRGFSPDPLLLRCVVEEVGAHKRVRVTMNLAVPRSVITGTEETYDVEAAIRGALQQIDRQLEAYKSTLRGEHWWKRVERRLETAGAPQPVLAENRAYATNAQWFFALAEPHMEAVRDLAGKVLRFVEARGDLPAHDLEVDDVIDAALTRAHEEFSKEVAVGDVRSRLMRFALDEIKAEVKRVQTDRRDFAPIEEDIPETPFPEDVLTLGDEILNFYEPEEDQHVEDILPRI